MAGQNVSPPNRQPTLSVPCGYGGPSCTEMGVQPLGAGPLGPWLYCHLCPQIWEPLKGALPGGVRMRRIRCLERWEKSPHCRWDPWR